ncbi:MAG: ChaN family lipoprotein [Bdellovibrionales bacterium]
MRAEWIKTRQQFLAQIKRQVQSRLGRVPRDLNAYIRRYNAEFNRPWQKSSHADLRKSVAESEVILGADFHAFSQSQRIHLRILRELPVERPVVLALEALAATDQMAIDQFMSGKLSEAQFLAQVKWDQAWGFPFENYKPLFELARERRFKVVGLNRHHTMGKMLHALPRRDQFGAEVIARWRERQPKALIYVVIGDLHLASGHLPAALQRVGKSRVLTILQNSEHLYFRLAKHGQEHKVDVMRAKGGRFCVLGSPPWVKWQSYLMYLEQTYDRDIDAGGMDYTDYVASYAVFIARDLGVQASLEDMAVFTPDQINVWRQLQRGLKADEKRMARAMIKCDRSFLLPQTGVLFLSRASINHAATLAGQFLHANLGDRTKTAWSFPSQFEAQIWIEAIGFFCSKLINHKRKADQLADLKTQLVAADPKGRGKDVLRLALAQRLSELTGKPRKLNFRPRRKEAYLEAARIVGHMLGDRLYQTVADKHMSMSEVVRLMQYDPTAAGFRDLYHAWVAKIDTALKARAEP